MEYSERTQNIIIGLIVSIFVILFVILFYYRIQADKASGAKFDKDMAEIESNLKNLQQEKAEYRKKHYFDPKVVFRKQLIPSKTVKERYTTRKGRHVHYRDKHIDGEFRVWYVNLNDNKVYMFKCPNKKIFDSIDLQDRVDSLSIANNY